VSRFARIVARDLRLALRQGSDASTVVLFFVLTACLFPFGVGPEPAVLARIAPGVIWVTVLLAVLLSLEHLFLADYEDGSLELLRLAPMPLELTVLAKVAAHWLTTGVPLVAAAPILALLLNMNLDGLLVMVAALLLGTPVMSLVGAVGAALALGARRGGILVPLLVLPLYIPVLIFGVGALDAAIGGFAVRPHLLVLGGLLLAALPLCPWVSAAALRQALG
jgi:heme exporter protein B